MPPTASPNLPAGASPPSGGLPGAASGLAEAAWRLASAPLPRRRSFIAVGGGGRVAGYNPDTSLKGLQLEVTMEDPKVFTAPLTACVTYR
jgi:hypothetical protein